mgnify:CR=1 FL=1
MEIDKNGKAIHYSPSADCIKEGVRYTDNGFWDTYRTVYPLFSLIAKEELEELIEWELYRPDGKHNPELFILLSDYLNQGLFFNTIEEAEKAMDDYENAKQKEVNYNALSYLTNFISRNLIK